MVRTLRGVEVSNMFRRVASSLGLSRSQDFVLCGYSLQMGLQWICGGVEEVGVCSQERCVAGSKARKEDRVCTIVNCPVVHAFTGGPSVNVQRMRGLAEA